MGWKVGGKFKREETCMYLWLIDVDVWQEPIQYCRAIMVQIIFFFNLEKGEALLKIFGFLFFLIPIHNFWEIIIFYS